MSEALGVPPRKGKRKQRTTHHYLYCSHIVSAVPCIPVDNTEIKRHMPRRRRPARPGALADLAPFRILTQIVVLQLLYYVCAAALIIFTTLVAGKEISLDLLFNWRQLRGDITDGWTLALCWMMDSLIWYARLTSHSQYLS